MVEQLVKKKKNWVDFRAVKEKADFRQVLAHYNLKLKTKGSELVGSCPFHDETRPSFRVNVEKKVFNCFGCNAKGNVLDFVARMEKVSIKKAAELLADTICDIGLEESPPAADKKPAPAKAPDPEENKPLTFELKLDPDHSYLKERNLTPETVAHFGLGYCNRGMLKGRIAIPIHDDQGNLVAYAGRWIGPETEIPEGEGKYKLPPAFKKSRVLFNLHRVPKDAKSVTLVEGFFPTIWLHQSGFPNVVAVMGTSISTEQKELLANRFQAVRILFDGDEPGQKGARAVAGELLDSLFVKIASCPDGRQPDHLTKDDLTALLQ